MPRCPSSPVAERHRRAVLVPHLSSSFASRGVVRSSLFLCAALPAISSAGPFFTFSLGFAFGAFAFWACRLPSVIAGPVGCFHWGAPTDWWLDSLDGIPGALPIPVRPM
jgi:hypothetical protein